MEEFQCRDFRLQPLLQQQQRPLRLVSSCLPLLQQRHLRRAAGIAAAAITAGAAARIFAAATADASVRGVPAAAATASAAA